jgi:aryl carrier-like protein
LDDVTARVFVPCKDLNNERIYRSGDLARWLPTGEMEFLGRKDNQVKVNGVRIELGDIENTMMHSDRVEQAVAAMMKINGKNCILAWILPRIQGVSSDSEELTVLPMTDEISEVIRNVKGHVSKCLPPYMMPSRLIPVSTIPKSTSGKIDRKCLVKLLESVDARVGMENIETISPVETSEETFLQTVWSHILGVGVNFIGRQSDFVKLGGDFISYLLLIEKFGRENITVNLASLMENSVLSDMALLLGKSRPQLLKKDTI